jgi:hypothetical protein
MVAMARLYAWLAALSLLSLGSLSAHALAYRIVEPGDHARRQLLQGTGHGYLLSAAPLVAGACVAFAVAALVAIAARAWRGASTTTPGWPFALLPPLGFAFQEHAERILSGADWTSTTALEPTFLTGLALQLPFALLALAIARRLARVAERLGRTFTTPAAPRAGVALTLPDPVDALLIPAGALALGHAGRGPPV